MGRTLRRPSSCVAGGVAFTCLLAASASAAPLPGPIAQLPLQTGASPAQTDYVPHELVVRFKPGTAASERSSLNAAQNARVQRDLLVPRAYLLRLSKGRDVRTAQRAYERNPNVQYAEPNYIFGLDATFPTDPQFSLLWGMNNTGQTVNGTAGTADADIDAPEAWDTTTGSNAVTVGVADTGIAYNHIDLASNIWANPGESGGGKETNNIDDDGNGKIDDFRGWDFIDNDNDPRDLEGHGTHVAGTIGAPANGAGLVGVSWAVRLAPLRMCGPNPLDSCNAAAAADAFTYAGQKGMQVVNGSFGGGAAPQVIADAINNAPDTLFVFAAGNSNNNNDTSGRYPCAFPAPNIICVAASDQNDNKAGFSNFGKTSVDLAAPGTNIVSLFTIPVRFRDNFQGGDFATKWTTGGTNNTWTTGCDTATPPNCVMLDSPGNYLNNTNSFARNTTAMSTTNMTGCRLQYILARDLGTDVLVVEASTNASTWTQVGGHSGTNFPNYDFSDLNLSAFDGQATVYVRFRLLSDASGTANGVFIDEVVVRCTPTATPNQLATADGTSQASPHVAGAAALAFAKEPLAPVAGVKNAILDGVDKKASLATSVGTGGRLNVNNMLTRLACCHVRPAGASPLIVSLVPEYVQCGVNPINRTHGPPLSNPSCTPPVKRSPYLTVGTPDANGAAANSVGQARLATLAGDPLTPADEADVKFEFSMTDVRRQTTGFPDYTGDLDVNFTFRLTDRTVGAGATATTLVDTSINPFFVVSCAATGSTTIGSTCSGTTTAEAILPGLLKEGARAIWRMDEIDIGDGGPDGDVFTPPNQIFATQGIFVP